MNRNLQAIQLEAPLYPIKVEKTEIIEIKTEEIKEIKVSESGNLQIEKRFERYKRNLRKKAHSIF